MVPFGLIRELCYSQGRRLERLPDMYPEPSVMAVYRPRATSSALALVPSHRVQDNEGNLSNEKYRLFMGRLKGIHGAVCRGCETSVLAMAEFRQHETNCKLTILSAIRLLQRDNRCALCHTRTDLSMWGVPLCSPVCQRGWRLTIPPAFREARRLALQELTK
jgi:hypothetical protein